MAASPASLAALEPAGRRLGFAAELFAPAGRDTERARAVDAHRSTSHSLPHA